MVWVISVILASLICGAIFFIGRAARSAATPGSPERFRASIVMVAAGVVFAVWVGLHTAVSSLKPIEAGHVGVVYQFGEIVGQKDEGLQFIAPWQTMKTASIRVQREQFDNISAFSKETQDVFVTVAVNFSVSKDQVQTLYREVGPNWFDVLIEPRVANFMKEETVKYSSVDIAPNREAIRVAVRERLAEDLKSRSITINDLLIQNIDFSPEFKTAIEGKQIATQDALREQEKVKQKQFEAQQAVETAKGEADATRERANGQADANRALAESLTPEVIQYQAVQNLSDKIQIALIPSGQGVILDPTTLLGGIKP
jgi:regulator of protease activity HflC (stomatin/prohibitin superfamily)